MPTTRRRKKTAKKSSNCSHVSHHYQYDFIPLSNLLHLSSLSCRCHLIGVVNQLTRVTRHQLAFRLCDPTVPHGLWCTVVLDCPTAKPGSGNALPRLRSGWVVIVHRAKFEAAQILVTQSDGAVLYAFSKFNILNGDFKFRLGANITAQDLSRVRQLFRWHQYHQKSECRLAKKTKICSIDATASALLKLDYNGNSQACLPENLVSTQPLAKLADCDVGNKSTVTIDSLILPKKPLQNHCDPVSVDELLSLAVSLPSNNSGSSNVVACLARVSCVMPALPDLLVWFSCYNCSRTKPVSCLVKESHSPDSIKCCSNVMKISMRLSLLLSVANKPSQHVESAVSASGILAHAFNDNAEKLIGISAKQLCFGPDSDRLRQQMLQKVQSSVLGQRIIIRVTYYRNANGVLCFRLDNGVDQIL